MENLETTEEMVRGVDTGQAILAVIVLIAVGFFLVFLRDKSADTYFRGGNYKWKESDENTRDGENGN